jgi:hypothetical protein
MAVAVGVYLWVHTATTKSAEDAVSPSDPGPHAVLQHYLAALYAREYKDAYRLIARVDMELKKEEEYLRENESFSERTRNGQVHGQAPECERFHHPRSPL